MFRRRGSAGFSLVELLLTLAIILGLITASVIHFTGSSDRSGLDEGSERFVTLLRFAQAEAANSGRKVRLSFDLAEDLSSETEMKAGGEKVDVSETPLRSIEVQWEADAVNRPGEFESIGRRSWNDSTINDLVAVTTIRALDVPVAQAVPDPSTTLADETEDLWGTSTEAEEASAAMEDEMSAETSPLWGMDEGDVVTSNAVETPSALHLTFYPDGTSDSTEIILAARSREDPRQIAVRIQGVLGRITRELLESGADDGMSELDDGLEDERMPGQSPTQSPGQPAESGTTPGWAETLLGQLPEARPEPAPGLARTGGR